MAARIYSEFPEKRLAHGTARPKTPAPPTAGTPPMTSASWSKGGAATSTTLRKGGAGSPKQSGGNFRLA